MATTPTMPGAGHAENMYRGQAMAQLRILKQQMALGGLKIGRRTVDLGNGVVCFCNICFNLEEVYVNVPKILTGTDYQLRLFLNFWTGTTGWVAVNMNTNTMGQVAYQTDLPWVSVKFIPTNPVWKMVAASLSISSDAIHKPVFSTTVPWQGYHSNEGFIDYAALQIFNSGTGIYAVLAKNHRYYKGAPSNRSTALYDYGCTVYTENANGVGAKAVQYTLGFKIYSVAVITAAYIPEQKHKFITVAYTEYGFMWRGSDQVGDAWKYVVNGNTAGSVQPFVFDQTGLNAYGVTHDEVDFDGYITQSSLVTVTLAVTLVGVDIVITLSSSTATGVAFNYSAPPIDPLTVVYPRLKSRKKILRYVDTIGTNLVKCYRVIDTFDITSSGTSYESSLVCEGVKLTTYATQILPEGATSGTRVKMRSSPMLIDLRTKEKFIGITRFEQAEGTSSTLKKTLQIRRKTSNKAGAVPDYALAPGEVTDKVVNCFAETTPPVVLSDNTSSGTSTTRRLSGLTLFIQNANDVANLAYWLSIVFYLDAVIAETGDGYSGFDFYPPFLHAYDMPGLRYVMPGNSVDSNTSIVSIPYGEGKVFNMSNNANLFDYTMAGGAADYNADDKLNGSRAVIAYGLGIAKIEKTQ